MAEFDWAALIYYGLLLLVIGGGVLLEVTRRGSPALRQLALWAVIFAGTVFAANLWLGQDGNRQRVTEGGRIEIPMGRDGHFSLTAELNGEPVRFLVDTGASTIALGPDDARRVGLDPDNLAYLGTSVTANGEVRTANVSIDEFAIGDIVDYNVPAVVIGGELDGSLLGMSYLRRFARVGFEGDLMVLER
ncbi:retropepsin-like aspartic protease family protein [Paracoccus sp. (in: a-proteobacteria)]|uniref:retropepsin-like aspartic protease family protein n=1 Tax=Paracoccus sp. TaxID=267 RepID=UPI003A851E74